MRLPYALAVLPLGSLHSTVQSPRPITNCPAAEAALGSESAAEAKVQVARFYSSRVDRTYLTFADRGFHAVVSWPGQGLPESVSAQLDISVPSELLASPITPADTLLAVLDRSVQVPLGELGTATLDVPQRFVPRFIPLSASLSSSSLLALARASSTDFVFRKKPIKASDQVQRGFNALFRALTCAQWPPAPSPMLEPPNKRLLLSRP